MAGTSPRRIKLPRRTSLSPVWRKRSTTQAVQFAYPGPPFPASAEGTDRIPGASTPAKNSFEATFSNLSAVAFQLDRMALDPAQRLSAKLTGDGPMTITLRGSFPPVDAMLDGSPVTVRQVAGGIELDLALTGQHNLVVRPL